MAKTGLTIQSRQEEQSKISANFLRRMNEVLPDPEEQRLFREALKLARLSWRNVIDQQGIQQPQVDKVVEVLLPDIPDISLKMFARAELTDLGVMGYAAINSDTVGRAMDLLYRYHELTSDRYFDTLEVEGEQAVVTPSPRIAHIHEFRNIAEDSLAGNWRTLTLLLGPGVDVTAAEARFGFPPPDYASTFAEVFSCRVRFGTDRSELRFPVSWLRRPVASANKAMADVCTAMCERLLGADTSRETPQVVRRLLLSRPGRRMYRLEEAAEALMLTPGQLRKRLYKAGTTYKKIVLDIRMALARHYLEDTALPVQEIAYLLDYSQPAPFSRAFKAYFGVSPEMSRQASEAGAKM